MLISLRKKKNFARTGLWTRAAVAAISNANRWANRECESGKRLYIYLIISKQE